MHEHCPLMEEGAGKAGCSASTRSLARNKKKRTSVVATGSPKQSDLPCAMVYGLFRALLGDRALLPPSLADRSANLTPASGVRTTRLCRPQACALVSSAAYVHRIPHPTFVTIAKRPS